jgi:hypothetical protein
MRNPSSESLSAHVYMTRILEQMPLFGILYYIILRSLKTVIIQVKLLLKLRLINIRAPEVLAKLLFSRQELIRQITLKSLILE